MHITPEICRAAYDYLRSTLPFRRWKYPKSDMVEFYISSSDNYYGLCDHFRDGKKFRITVSNSKVSTTLCLIETIAHEMCHMRQRMTKAYKPAYGHGKDFQAYATQVCKYHGFNKDYF